MTRYLVPLAVIFSLAATSASAQQMCADLFASRGLAISSEIYSPIKQADPVEAKNLALRVLQMAAASRDGGFNEKQVLEKGELVLAQGLNSGWSVEAEYILDHRGPSPVFRMKSLYLLKPNGESVSLDKSPIDVSGTKLKNFVYSLADVDKSLQNSYVQFPVMIEGALFAEIQRWVGFSEFVKIPEFRAIGEGQSVGSLRAKVFGRSVIDYSNKVIKKQSFKFALLGFVMYLYSQKDQISRGLVIEDPWEKMLKAGRLEAITPDLLRTVEADLALFAPGVNFSLVKGEKDPSKLKYKELGKVLTEIEDLIRFEREKGGRPSVAFTDSEIRRQEQKGSLLSYKKIGSGVIDNEGKDFLLVIHLPVTQRVVVLSEWMTRISGSVESIIPIVFEKSTDPITYGFVLKAMNSLKKDLK